LSEVWVVLMLVDFLGSIVTKLKLYGISSDQVRTTRWLFAMGACWFQPVTHYKPIRYSTKSTPSSKALRVVLGQVGTPDLSCARLQTEMAV
jgi:hypothetical protein